MSPKIEKPQESEQPQKSTVPKLAKRWGVGESKVSDFIKSGELRAINIARNRNGERPRYLIDEQDIEAFERARQVIPAVSDTTPKLRRRSTANVKRFFR